jgi:hypothetical protein
MTKTVFLNKWTLLAVTFVIAGLIIVSPVGPENRSAQDIAIVFGLPIALLDTLVPYALFWLLATVLPSTARTRQPTLPFSSYNRQIKILIWMLGVTICLSLISVALTIALYGASFLYPLLEVSWATAPARHLAKVVFLAGMLPAFVLVVFGAGFYSAHYVSRNLTLVVEKSADLAMRILLDRTHPV